MNAHDHYIRRLLPLDTIQLVSSEELLLASVFVGSNTYGDIAFRCGALAAPAVFIQSKLRGVLWLVLRSPIYFLSLFRTSVKVLAYGEELRCLS